MPRPKLLFVAQCLPFPANSGVRIRTFNLLRLLAREYDILVLCFYRRSGHRSEQEVVAAVNSLAKYGTVKAHRIPQEHSGLRRLWDHARSVLLQRTYTYFAYSSGDFQSDLDSALESFRPDLIHVDSLDLSWCLERLGSGVPVVCGHHNVESALLQRRAESEAPMRKWYIQLQSRLTEKEERNWMPRVSLNVACSDIDCDLLRQIAPDATCVTASNGVNTKEISELPDASSGVVFVGGSSWFPNRDALFHFVEDILPHVRSLLPSVRVTWVGQCSPEDKERMKREHDVDLTGYVSDIAPFVEAAACYVVPLRVGGGTRLKILYAWSMGRAIVSTSIGCEGLDAIDGVNIVIRDRPEEFAAAIARVVADSEFRQRISREGRATAENQYDWEVIGEKMLADYRNVLALQGGSRNASVT